MPAHCLEHRGNFQELPETEEMLVLQGARYLLCKVKKGRFHEVHGLVTEGNASMLVSNLNLEF